MNRHMAVPTLAILLLAGCATAGSSGFRPGSGDTLEADEIQAAGAEIQTAYDAVERLRPRFLRLRANATAGVGTNRADPVVVYINGIRRGGVAELRRIRAAQVERIHYVRPTDAQTRYGNNHGSGAIEVTLKGG
ncbi:MAG: hypothetical protein P8Z36_06870 [Gemmatimonadota bacterium]|jgi:hypothetical protein